MPMQEDLVIKQVVQNLRSGVLELLDVPCPVVARGQLLIQSRASLISAGTERSLVEFGKANLWSKARQQPERVQQVLNKIRTDGLLPTLEAVFSKLDEPLPLGYCNAGVVLEVGEGCDAFQVGDHVASNGGHAEFVSVPQQLCAKIPDGVPFDEAAFAVIGSIGLHGLRLLEPAIGESIAVFGLGLVGQLAVQLAVASGAHVLGIDLDPARLEMAKQFGATPVPLHTGTDPVQAALAFTRGHGVDGVLITASAKGDTIVNQSAHMARKRGRIVMVGVTDTHLERAVFYEKELSFQVSCSYGPGRYDPEYEQRGRDYPYAYVRWTEQRNFQAVLELIQTKRLQVQPLITAKIPHADASRAYEILSQDRSQMGIVLQYPEATPARDTVIRAAAAPTSVSRPQSVVAAMIGAGNFSKGVLLPAIRRNHVPLQSIASAKGVSGAHAARKFGIATSTSDYHTILADPLINTVFITTRHHQHAPMVVEALQAGKHVFVEKPLAIDREGLERVQQAYAASSGLHLMVGYNRRFSPHAQKISQLLQGRSQPACLIMTVNAGRIPADHWAHDPHTGGGRLIGEGCHWVDLFRFLVGAPVASWQVGAIGNVPGVTTRDDHMSLTLRFHDGSLGTIHYFANGHRQFPKETLTVFCEGKMLELDNFRTLRGSGWKGFRRQSLWRQDKGHNAEIAAFCQRIARGGENLISPDQLWETSRITIEAADAIRASH